MCAVKTKHGSHTTLCQLMNCYVLLNDLGVLIQELKGANGVNLLRISVYNTLVYKVLFTLAGLLSSTISNETGSLEVSVHKENYVKN